MAHLRAVIRGTRGEASRLGTKSSGIHAKLQTWGYDLLLNVQHCSKKTADQDHTLEAGDWAVIELAEHGNTTGRLVARINLTTGEVIATPSTCYGKYEAR